MVLWHRSCYSAYTSARNLHFQDEVDFERNDQNKFEENAELSYHPLNFEVRKRLQTGSSALFVNKTNVKENIIPMP